MILVHWRVEDIVPKDTVLEGTDSVEVVEVMVVEGPVGTGLQEVQVEEVPVGDVVVHVDIVVPGIWRSAFPLACWMSTGLLEFPPQDSSVVTAPEDATGPEIALGETAVHGLKEAGVGEISCVAGLVIHVGALGGLGPVDLGTFGWVVVVAGDPVSLGKGARHVGSGGQDCVVHHNNDYTFHGDFLDQLPWVHL